MNSTIIAPKTDTAGVKFRSLFSKIQQKINAFEYRRSALQQSPNAKIRRARDCASVYCSVCVFVFIEKVGKFNISIRYTYVLAFFFFSLISFRSFAHAFAYFYATKICARRKFGERTSCRYGEKPCLGNTKKKNYVGIRACGTVYIFLFLRVSSRTMNMRAHKRYVSHNIIRYDIQLLLLL